MTSVWKRRLSYVVTMTSIRNSIRSAQGSSSATSLQPAQSKFMYAKMVRRWGVRLDWGSGRGGEGVGA